MRTKNQQKVSTGREGAPVVMSLEYIQAKKDWAKFEGLAKEDFEKKVRAMSDCDLSNYLPKFGLRPTGDRRQMIMAVMKKYEESASVFTRQEIISQNNESKAKRDESVDANYESFLKSFRPV